MLVLMRRTGADLFGLGGFIVEMQDVGFAVVKPYDRVAERHGVLR